MEHPIAGQITSLLREHNYWFETFNHQPVRTSEEATKLRPGYSMQQGAKAIIVRVKIPYEGKKFLMLVFPGDKRFDDNKVIKLTGSKDVRFATEDEVDKITNGVKPGGVPPFGNLFNLEVISDKSLYYNEKIAFNAGRTSTIIMKSEDYKKLVKPVIETIV